MLPCDLSLDLCHFQQQRFQFLQEFRLGELVLASGQVGDLELQALATIQQLPRGRILRQRGSLPEPGQHEALGPLALQLRVLGREPLVICVVGFDLALGVLERLERGDAVVLVGVRLGRSECLGEVLAEHSRVLFATVLGRRDDDPLRPLERV